MDYLSHPLLDTENVLGSVRKQVEGINELAREGTHSINPYHNHRHCQQVLYAVCRILEEEYENKFIQLRPSVIWATLFHDYNHSGGKCGDDLNIEYATLNLRHHYIHYYQQLHNLDVEKGIYLGESLQEALNMIKCTMFVNGGFPHEPRTIEERAIRDADLCSIFLPQDDAVRAMKGLYMEMTLTQPMSRQEFWTRNEEFLRNVNWYTDYCKQNAGILLDSALENVGRDFLG